MGSEGFIGDVLAGFADALEPLEVALSGPDEFAAFTADLGWAADPAPSAAQLQAAFGNLGPHLAALAKAAQTFRALPAQAGLPAIATAVEQLGAAIASVASDVVALTGTATSGLPSPLDQAAFWDSLAEELLGKLLYDYLQDQLPALLGILRFLGIAGADPVPADGQRDAFTRHNIDWARLSSAVSKPGQVFADVYGWGGTFDHIRFIDNLLALFGGFGAPVSPNLPEDALLDLYYDPTSPVRRTVVELRAPLYWGLIDSGPVTTTVEFSLVMLPIPASGDTTGQPVGFVLAPELTAQAAETTALTASTELALSGSFGSVGIVRMEVRPTGVDVAANGSGSTTTFSAAAKLTASPAPPWVLLGSPGSTRLEVGTAHVALGIAGPISAPEVTVEVAIDTGQFVLDFSESDGFLQGILGDQPQKFAFTIGGRWSSRSGLTLNGQGRIDATIPVNQSVLGIIEIDSIYISAGATAGQNPGAQLVLAATGTAQLGPISVSISRVGLQASVSPPAAGTKGNLGDVAVAFGFKPPDGLGLAISAPVVSGGGFLGFDNAAGRYLGAVELSVAGVGVQGVGVLATRVPGGGWSLVVLADVTGLMVQLGFGIELNGVGVLVGVNRTMNVIALQAMARSGGLTDLMFPADLAANAPRVASELDGVFPSCRGQFVVGPTMQLIWGTGSLVTADLAIYIEFPGPSRVAVLGSIDITVPTRVVPVVQLHLDIAGIIDLAAKTLSLDMSLSRSNLAGFPITGQAALRTGWGENPVFLLAVGGFNPHFSPPAGFPSLARLSLTYGGLFQQVRFSAYLALTSNTFQLGAEVDLRFAAGPAAFTASVSFDALVQYKPFHLELDLAICAAVTLDGTSIMSLQIVAHLSGPGPWHLSGKVHFSILFFSFTIPISATFGSSLPSVEPSTVDVVGLLTSAIADPASWVLTPPPGPPLVIVWPGADQAALHPLGQLVLRQRVAPLELPVDRFGTELLPAVTALSLSSGGASSSGSGVTDLFAPAQFISMTDAQKLSAPSFEQLTSGLSLHPDGWVVPVTSGSSAVAGSGPATLTASTRDWDPLVVDIDPASGTAAPPYVPAAVAVADDQIQAQLTGAVAAQQGSAAQGPGRYPGTPLGIGAQPPQYTLATPAMANTVTAGSWISSHALASAIRPAGLQIVHPSELHS